LLAVAEAPRPTGQLTPVPPRPQYPPGFFGEYILEALFAPIPLNEPSAPAAR
jgi:hypothetical protein